MRQLVLAALLLFSGCVPVDQQDIADPLLYWSNPPTEPLEIPMVNIPITLRQSNYTGVEGEGSCVHATMVTAFHQQGQPVLARHWRATYSDGEWADESYNKSQNLVQKLESEGVPYAYVTDGDEEFLEWACRTRRGCGVAVNGGSHMVLLVHIDDETVGLVDNNQVNDVLWVPRDRFIAEWKASMGWAVTPVFDPVPPIPRS